MAIPSLIPRTQRRQSLNPVHHCSTQMDAILDAMEYAVYAFDVRHVVLDNLQFMMAGGRRGVDIFAIQDEAIHAMRMFASEKNIHITLVAHPRKVDDDKPIQISSIFGSAKATQESDNVIILQDNNVHRYLEIKKNRFDGEVGTVVFKFDTSSMLFRSSPFHSSRHTSSSHPRPWFIRHQQNMTMSSAP